MEQMLIKRCKKGDLTAFEILISDHQMKVYNLAYRLIGNSEDAKDISQEAFIKVFRNIQSFREESSFSTWLYRVVINSSQDFLRKKRNTFSLEEIKGERDKGFKDESSLNPAEEMERADKRQTILLSLYKLSEEHRIIIVLRDIQGFSYEEIAEILHINLGTVKSRINRARYHLKNLLEKE